MQKDTVPLEELSVCKLLCSYIELFHTQHNKIRCPGEEVHKGLVRFFLVYTI